VAQLHFVGQGSGATAILTASAAAVPPGRPLTPRVAAHPVPRRATRSALSPPDAFLISVEAGGGLADGGDGDTERSLLDAIDDDSDGDGDGDRDGSYPERGAHAAQAALAREVPPPSCRCPEVARGQPCLPERLSA
jgi:hypothetical protein